MSNKPNETSPAKVGVRRGLVEQEIFDQATRLFAQRGFSGTSFQDIADAVGLTRPALYHYVKSKEDLLARLVAEITVVAATDVASISRRNDVSATERLRNIVEHMVRQQGEQGERFRLLLRSEADLPESVSDSYAANRRAVLRSITSVVEEGVALGEFRTVTPAIAALGTLGIVNWVAWWYHPNSAYDLDAVCTELAELAVHSVAAEDGRQVASTPLDVLRSVRRDIDRIEGLLSDPV
ncbi:MAG: regulatory protein TetR [Subtercola sp.]|nr:regulatory protein TetR [Subtercola sp.]